MAERRMISKRLVSSDQFLDLPLEAQALYFRLILEADDDGFLSNAMSVSRMLGLPGTILSTLVSAGYLISFDFGVIAIRHWRVCNAIRKDRYTPTLFQREFHQLRVDASGVYERKADPEKDFPAANQQNEPEFDSAEPAPETQTPESAFSTSAPANLMAVPASPPHTVEIETAGCSGAEGEEESGSTRRNGESLPCVPTLEEVRKYAMNRKSKANPDRFFDYYSATDWKKGASSIRDWQAAFRCWESREKDFVVRHSVFSCKPPLHTQHYSQRDYSGAEESMEEVLFRLEPQTESAS